MDMDKPRQWIGGVKFSIALAGLPLLTACTGNTLALDDGIPNTPPPAVIVQTSSAPQPGPAGARNTGTYPSLSPTLRAAAEQIEDDDYANAESRLAALARARSSGSISQAEYDRRVAEYRDLAAGHGAQTEADIAR